MAIEVNSKLTASIHIINSDNMNNKIDNNQAFKADLKTAENIDTKNNMDTADEKIKARKERIEEIKKDYETYLPQYPEVVALLDTDIMSKVVDLHVEGNEKYYNNGKISIDKVAEDCGLSLDDISPKELNSIREELDEEGVLDSRTNKDLENFIDRAYFNNRSSISDGQGYSSYDFRIGNCNSQMAEICKEAFEQKINCFDKCRYFINMDKECNQFLSQSVMENVFDIFNA